MGSTADHITILTGAGASIPAGFPDVVTLTRTLDTLLQLPPPDKSEVPGRERRMKESGELLRILWEITRDSPFYQANATYEDLAYSLDALRGTVAGAYPDPLLETAVADVARRIGITRQELAQRALYAEIALHEVVQRTIAAYRPTRLDHLDFVAGARRAGRLRCLATLNFDTLHEHALTESGVTFADGMTERVGSDIYFWTDSFNPSDLEFLKLHGSLSWHVFNHPDRRRGMTVARFDGADPMHPLDLDGGILIDMIPGETTETLIGSFNKARHYLRSPYSDLLRRFQVALLDSNAVVITGYSFSDPGINSALINWMTGPVPRRILLVHADPESARASARPAIQNWWERWVGGNRLQVLTRWIEQAHWSDIASLL